MIAKSYALFKKDFSSELRTRYAINSLAMFIIVAISVILFSIGNETINENLTGGLFWVVIFFTAMSGLARAFVSEEERGFPFREGRKKILSPFDLESQFLDCAPPSMNPHNHVPAGRPGKLRGIWSSFLFHTLCFFVITFGA